MSFSKKLIVVALLGAMLAGILYVGEQNNRVEEETKKNAYAQTETVHLWYSDDTFTDYFTNAAVAFHEKHPEIRVIPTYVSSSEYLEKINEASLSNEEFPDIYLLTNDSLEKAYLAGLASKVRDSANVLNSIHFGKGALNAVTYRNDYVAYPLTFETSVLLYNKTYLNDWVELVNSGQNQTEGEGLSRDEMEFAEGDEGYDDIFNDEVFEKTQKIVALEDYIPKSFDDIKEFASSYAAPAGVEGILKWDVSDIFYNYHFVGNYMIVGGESGDDTSNIDVYNANTISCMQTYQALNSSFSIDAASSDYNSVLQDFLDGKCVYTIVTSDALKKAADAYEKRKEEYDAAVLANMLDEEESEGEEEKSEEELPKVYEYAFARIPDVSDSLSSKSLSVTDSLVINGYSEKKASADKFAAFVTTEYAGNIYQRTGRLAASTDVSVSDEAVKVFMDEYANSIPLSKIVEASNLWVQLEIAFRDIWAGEDVDARLHAFANQIDSQLVNE